MEFRSALATAISMGAVLGAILVGLNLPTPGSAATAPNPALEMALPPIMAAEAAPEVTWDLPIVRNESVDRFVNLFERKQSERMALYLKRSGRYEGMIREKLRERGMPEDLVYLSMIESGFNPTAKSKAQAVGLWQFIAGTGRNYGLRIDS